LTDLVNKLSLINNIEYFSVNDHSANYRDSLKNAKRIEPKIEDIGDLKKYFIYLKKEINKRELFCNKLAS